MANNEKQVALNIGRAIALQRQQAGLTQADLAEVIGVEQETISRFERGATLPPLARLCDIADALACPLENLLRTSSNRISDNAQKMALALDGLSDADRKMVVSVVEQICERLQSTPQKMPK